MQRALARTETLSDGHCAGTRPTHEDVDDERGMFKSKEQTELSILKRYELFSQQFERFTKDAKLLCC